MPGGGKFVHVDDVAKAAVACCTRRHASGAVLNLADCYARWGPWAVMAAQELGMKDARVDLSSSLKPIKSVPQSLGVSLDRGHEGIREHLRRLIAAMEQAHRRADGPRRAGGSR